MCYSLEPARAHLGVRLWRLGRLLLSYAAYGVLGFFSLMTSSYAVSFWRLLSKHSLTVFSSAPDQ
jgi:hypothetical protein